ncbi:arsenate reductase family protein [Geobacillus thermoleovorans]|uniref:Transcriptional regulator, Spx/MgsR family protein n=1 Tax=Geobacillus kaustophilus TaxID=1462 RepID=A0A0D8BX14_GEOKU|nr:MULTISPECIES: arsenate reductase family protein [Geobacillus]KAF0996328.1 Regulatory protein Spx [Geobacillus sp. TFV-3]KJE28721.1 transcriptional regulator, Spx/MgsR family protein [Geobacillus kaustophilus]
MALTLYWYPKCGTCRKAKKWLDEHGVEVQTVHLVDEPLTKEELAELHRKSGLPLKKFFNTSGMKYRELGLKDKLDRASEDEMLDWLASDGMLVKRPILTDGERVVVGFREQEYEAFFAKKA